MCDQSTGAKKMKVPFAALRMHFPDRFNVSREELYHWIGYPENIENPNFENTCAIRISLALLGAGFPNPGTWPIKAGKYKGRMIETRQKKLSNWLVRQLGQPEKFKSGQEAQAKIGTRNGLISFFKLNGPIDNQGHIDIVMIDRWGKYLRCNNDNADQGGCYWDAVSIWFWPLR
jgi:hypothetical protein